MRPPPFQIDNVLKLRKRGLSLRAIADETSLSLNTVCTIIGNQTKPTRARRKRYERIQPDKFADATGSRGAGHATHCRSASMP